MTGERMIRPMMLAGAALALSACDRSPPSAPPAALATRPAVEARPDAPSASPTLRAIRARGRIRCGVHPGLPGFAYQDNRRRWRGFDVDLCRAVAAAVLRDPERVEFRPLSNEQRLPALLAGEVDVVMRNVTWTLARDGGGGVDFAGVSYYDGQGFLVRRALALQSASELNGAAVCVQTGTTNTSNLADWASGVGLEYTRIPVRDEAEGRAALQEERCDALAGDVSALAASRTMLNNPGAFALLPEVISREPLGPMVREGDSEWRDVVFWTLNALLLAEQLRVTQASAEEQAAGSRSAEVRRLLGSQRGAGAALGLEPDWGLRVLLAVGHYGEIFERNLGAQSPLRLQRGLNALWSAPAPGLHYPLPLGDAQGTEPTDASDRPAQR